MSRFATDEIPEPMYRNFVNGLLERTMDGYRKEIKEKMNEIQNDTKEEKVESQALLRKMYNLSLVYRKLMEKVRIENKKENNFCDLV
jgi:hypothetical protein